MSTDPTKTLTTATLHKLDDGMTGRVIDQKIQEALRDCEDRPGLAKVRKVTIQLELTPQQDDRTYALRGVDTAVQVAVKVPPTGTRTEYLRTTHDSAKKEVVAALADTWQDGIDFESGEGSN